MTREEWTGNTLDAKKGKKYAVSEVRVVEVPHPPVAAARLSLLPACCCCPPVATAHLLLLTLLWQVLDGFCEVWSQLVGSGLGSV